MRIRKRTKKGKNSPPTGLLAMWKPETTPPHISSPIPGDSQNTTPLAGSLQDAETISKSDYGGYNSDGDDLVYVVTPKVQRKKAVNGVVVCINSIYG